ncbi:hypothetical protein GGR45_001502 [Sphingomonas zeae]|jgi:hypothetical protein|nr:hypothetical protein [Sphingomonas zeae]
MKIPKLAILAAAMTSTIAAAQYTDYAYVKVYYTDATRQHVAGRETAYCSGDTEYSGSATPYYRYYNGTCP